MLYNALFNKRGSENKSSLDKADDALSRKDWPALTDAAEEIICSLKGKNEHNQHLIEPLVIMADRLVQRPDFLTHGLSIYQGALKSVVFPEGRVGQAIVSKIIMCAENHPDNKTAAQHLWSAALFAKRGSDLETKAVDLFVQKVEALPSLAARMETYLHYSHKGSIYQSTTSLRCLPSDSLLMHRIVEQFENCERALTQQMPERAGSRDFIKKHAGRYNLGS